jgi:hypothetical protein
MDSLKNEAFVKRLCMDTKALEKTALSVCALSMDAIQKQIRGIRGCRSAPLN